MNGGLLRLIYPRLLRVYVIDFFEKFRREAW